MMIRVIHDGQFKELNHKDQYLDGVTDLSYNMKLSESNQHSRCYDYLTELGFTGIRQIIGFFGTNQHLFFLCLINERTSPYIPLPKTS